MRRVILLALVVCLFHTGPVRADPVDIVMHGYMREHHVPGAALAVIRHGRVVKLATYGLATLEWRQTVTRTSPFWLDSLTKLVTAVGVMQLADQGRLSLDASITRYLPHAPSAWQPVTVRHLLAHLSGIKDDYWETYKGSPLVQYDPKDIYAYTLKQPLHFTPGERSQYDNAGYYLLGVIIEQVTHTPYPEWITAHVLRPAGMRRATTYDPWRIIPHMVSSYSLKAGQVVRNRSDILSDRGTAIAGWGVYASVDDMVAFDRALRSGKLLARRSLETMWSNARLKGGAAAPSGLGFESVSYYRGHRWAAKGGQAGVAYAVFPEDDVSVILLTNMESSDLFTVVPVIASSFIPGLRPLASLTPKPDPDPQRTATLRRAMHDVAAGVSPLPQLTTALNAQVTPELRADTGRLLAAMSSFDFLACEPPSPKDPYGVATYCYYRTTLGPTTLNLVFGLTTLGQIATMGGVAR